MFNRLLVFAALFGAACSGSRTRSLNTTAAATNEPRYPASRQESTVDTIHGTTVPDPYRWLEDSSKPDVQAWIREQDATADAYLRRIPERHAIEERLRELMDLGSVHRPVRHEGFSFMLHRSPGQEKEVLAVRHRDGTERILLNPNNWRYGPTVSLQDFAVSPNGKLLVYTTSVANADIAIGHVLDIVTGETKEDVPGMQFGPARWAGDSSGFYYTWYPSDEKNRGSAFGESDVRFHKSGTDPRADTVIAEKTGDPNTELDVFPSSDGHWLILRKGFGWRSSDIFFKDARQPHATWAPLVLGRDSSYLVLPYKDMFYALTDDGAPKNHVFRIDPTHPERASWREVIPERSDATLKRVIPISDHLVLTWLKQNSSELEIASLDGTSVRSVSLPGIGMVEGPGNLDDLAQDEDGTTFFEYESYTQPPQVYRLSIASTATEVHDELHAPIRPADYVVERVPFRAKDGTSSFMFLVHGKNVKQDGSAPALLWGYGAHGVSVPPVFASSIFALLDRGAVYAAAVLRGGGEFGEDWHRAGMGKNKQHTFDDFIAAGEELVREGWTRSDRLGIYGGSMGGLAVGAATTQRPDLFRVAIMDAPILDLIRYPVVGGVGKRWLSELGDPAKDDEFRSLLAFSPYHHIHRGTRYPAQLVLSPEADDRVDPMHARKFVAAMQNASTDGPVLLRVLKTQAHSGPDSVTDRIRMRADMYSFFLANVARN